MSRILFIGATQMATRILAMPQLAFDKDVIYATLAPDDAKGICDYRLPPCNIDGAIIPYSVDAIKSSKPDLILVVGWSSLIPPEVLAIPPRGTVCFHAAKLPDYRGRAPIPHTILHDLGYTEMTMFYADEKADSGDIIASKGFYVGYKDDAGTLYEKHTKAIIALLDEHLDGLLAGTAPRRKQEGDGEWWEKRTPEMGEIDWTDQPLRLIRALTKPYPGAFTYWKGRKFWIWKADEIVNSDHNLAHFNEGEILAFDEIGGAIIMGENDILLTASETQDGEVIPAYELAMKWGMKAGDKLGRQQ